MSLQAQAIIPGHPTADEIAALLEKSGAARILGYRTMRRPEHVLFELQDDAGNLLCVEAFLNSWAAEDYAEAYPGPGTLLTAEHNPVTVALLTKAATGGMTRPHDMAKWEIPSAPAN